MFKKLFGGEAASAQPGQYNVATANKTISGIQNLTEHEEGLEKRKSMLEKRVEAEQAKAVEFLRLQKKPQALQCIRRRKLYEQELANLDNMIMRVSEQRMLLESQNGTVGAVAAMRDAAGAARANMSAMHVDKVEEVIDDIDDVTDKMKQLNEVFAAPLGMGADVEDDDLLAELEGLEEEQLQEQLLEPAHVPIDKVPATQGKLPSVPQKQKQQPTKGKEEEELEALQAEMGLAAH